MGSTERNDCITSLPEVDYNEDSHQDALLLVPAESWDVNGSQDTTTSQSQVSFAFGDASWLPRYEHHTQTLHVGDSVPPGYYQGFPVGEYSQPLRYSTAGGRRYSIPANNV